MTSITGYRELSEEEVVLINKVKRLGLQVEEIVTRLRGYDDFDQRWVSIGATDLQKGLMALTRAIARPTTF